MLGRTYLRHGIPHRLHPRNPSSALPNHSRSAEPAGTITSAPSPADFRTHTAARSNLHSARRPSYPTSRAFLHWRLSDDGPGASRIVAMGRHPKPFTKPEELELSNCLPLFTPHNGRSAVLPCPLPTWRPAVFFLNSLPIGTTRTPQKSSNIVPRILSSEQNYECGISV
jgi:hypothetical protein